MRNFSPIILIAAVTFSQTSSAQQWSSQQKEIIQHIQSCLDTWRGKDFDRWLSVCHPDSGAIFWNTNNGSPNRLEYWRKTALAQWNQTQYLYSEMRPLEILVYRDVAIVHYYYVSGYMLDGQRVNSEQKRMEVFRKVGGRWNVIGGMFSPSPTR